MAWTMDLPDAQKVGHAFVRQYYTVLHEDPGYLHRLHSTLHATFYYAFYHAFVSFWVILH